MASERPPVSTLTTLNEGSNFNNEDTKGDDEAKRLQSPSRPSTATSLGKRTRGSSRGLVNGLDGNTISRYDISRVTSVAPSSKRRRLGSEGLSSWPRSQPSTERRWSYSTRTFQQKSLPVLENLAFQILTALQTSRSNAKEEASSSTYQADDSDADPSIFSSLIALFQSVRACYTDAPDEAPFIPIRLEGVERFDGATLQTYRRANLVTLILHASGYEQGNCWLSDQEFLPTLLSGGSEFSGPAARLYLNYKTQLFLTKIGAFADETEVPESALKDALEALFPEDLAYKLVAQAIDVGRVTNGDVGMTEVDTWLVTKALSRKSYLRRACLAADGGGKDSMNVLMKAMPWQGFAHELLDWISGKDLATEEDCPHTPNPLILEPNHGRQKDDDMDTTTNHDAPPELMPNVVFDTDTEIQRAIARATREIEATYNLESQTGNFSGQITTIFSQGTAPTGTKSGKPNSASAPHSHHQTRSASASASHKHAHTLEGFISAHTSNNDAATPSLAEQALRSSAPSASQAAYTAARDLISKRQAEALAAQLAAQQAQHESLLSTIGSGSPLPASLTSTHSLAISLPAQRRPWSIDEEQTLLKGLDLVGGPHWSKILNLFGQSGSVSEVLAGRTQVQLKDKARNLKLWFLKEGLQVPKGLSGVTGDLEKRGRVNTVRSGRTGAKDTNSSVLGELIEDTGGKPSVSE